MASSQLNNETQLTICDRAESTTHAASAASRQDELRSRLDLERALQLSRESEARLRKIVDAIPTLAWSNLADRANEFVNERWFEYVGVLPKQGQAWSWRAAIHPEDLQRVTDTWEELLCSGKPGEFEARLRRYDGVFRWFFFRAEPKRNQAGAVVSWYGTATDIEDRKRTESLHVAEMRTLQMITDGASLTDILNHVCTSIDLQISPSVTTILLMDPDGKRLWPSAGPKVPHDWTHAITPLPVSPDAGLCGTAAFSKTRVIVPDVATEPNWQEEYRDVALKNGIRAGWSQPILTKDNQVLGTFAIYSAEPRVPTDADLGLIEAAGRVALIAIERQRSQEALRSALDEIRKSEEELRRMTDAIAQTIVVLNPDGRVTYANRVALEYFGLSLDEVRADNFRKRAFHPDDVQRLLEQRQKALSGSVPFENEQRALGKDGRYRWFLIRYHPLLDESGKVIHWYATGTDIEDRKQAEDRMRNETVALREDIVRSSMFEEIVGSSETLRKVLGQVSRVAPTDSTVLILGETGTGKELIARAIHNRSKRAGHAFIRVNCAAIPPSLIASELFGHEKGSFTGAIQQHMGRFEAADGGTIFLDEVGDLPAETQLALLRVLQEREIERVGSVKPIRIDVRVIAATNRELEEAVADRTFRQDLFYRLNIFPIRIPSLRERADDISLLVEYFVERYAKKAGKKIKNISKKTYDLFQSYQWPGNIRELQNVIERAVILCDGETFSVDETWLNRENRQPSEPTVALAKALENSEREAIETALADTHGKVGGFKGAAAKLGIPRQTLESKIKALGINKFRFKTP